MDRFSLGNARPLILRGESTLNSNAQNSPNAIALSNPSGEPFEITELKFSLRPDDPLIGHTSGAFIWIEMKLGNKPITDGYVPIWLLGPAKILDLEQYGPQGWGYVLNSNFAGKNGLSFARRADAVYSMKLDHPMFVQPGEILAVNFQHAGMLDVKTRVGISVKGRTRSSSAAKTRVPFVSWWQSKFFEWDGAAEEDFSPENTLNNKLSSTLHIERFCGRIPQSIQFISPPYPELTATQQMVVEDGQNGFLERWLTVRMWDSMGNQIVRTPVLFRNVFGWERAWNTRHDLPSGAYYKTVIRKTTTPADFTLNSVDASNKTVAFRGAAQIGFVGWREEKL